MAGMKTKVIEQGEGGDTRVVVEYVPKKFPIEMTDSANDFESSQGVGSSDFEINNLLAEITGIADKRRFDVEERIEALTLEKLKSVEEKAYNEAYDLGLIEGSEKAFSEKTAEIERRIDDLELLKSNMVNITTNLIAERETGIIKFLTELASKIAMFEVTIHQEKMIGLIEQMLEEMQGDERVLIKVAPSDAEFLRQAKQKLAREDQVLANIKIEEDPDLFPGGCIMESNHGAIDASIKMRVSRAWKAVKERLPRIKEDRIELKEAEPENFEASSEVDQTNSPKLKASADETPGDKKSEEPKESKNETEDDTDSSDEES